MPVKQTCCPRLLEHTHIGAHSSNVAPVFGARARKRVIRLRVRRALAARGGRFDVHMVSLNARVRVRTIQNARCTRGYLSLIIDLSRAGARLSIDSAAAP